VGYKKYNKSKIDDTETRSYSKSNRTDDESTDSSESRKCEERVFKNKCHEEDEKCVVDKHKRVIHEKICKIQHINKVYIQPICRTVHSKKTIVYKLPVKYIDDGCQKDHGVEYVKTCKDDTE